MKLAKLSIALMLGCLVASESRGGTVLYESPEQLARRAEAVVQGEVHSRTPELLPSGVIQTRVRININDPIPPPFP